MNTITTVATSFGLTVMKTGSFLLMD